MTSVTPEGILDELEWRGLIAQSTDRDALADLIRRLRSVDPVQTLDSLLQDLRLGKYPLLHGKIFQLTVGVGVSPGHSIELLEADGLAVSAESGGRHARS